MNQFTLFNTEEAKSNSKKLTTLRKSNDGKDFVEVYATDTHFIFYKMSKGITRDTENQLEIPKESLSWIIRIIQEGFWQKPTEGGIPKNQHSVKKNFDGEEIIITRSMNAGKDNEKGFKISNKSRKSYIVDFKPQQIQITDVELVNNLIPHLNR